MTLAFLLLAPAVVVLAIVAFVRGWDFPDDEPPESEEFRPRVGGWRT